MSKNIPVQFGIIGAGRIAHRQFAPALKQSAHAELAAAASRDLQRAKALGPKRAYDHYDALLEDGEVEAVYIATHNGLHHPLTIRALVRGKHVLCEKPLACTVAECSEMIAAARQHQRLLVEAFMYRYHPQIDKAVELLSAGAIGDISAVEASFSFMLADGGDVRLNHEWGGGSLYDVGCYCVNVCRLLFRGMPLAVKAMAQFDPVHRVDVSLHGTLDFGQGRYGIISCGFDGGLRNRVLVSGTQGTLELPGAFISWEKPPSIIINREEEREVMEFEPTNVYQAEIDDFAQAIRGGPPPRLALEEGLLNARVFEALLASAKSEGSAVPV